MTKVTKLEDLEIYVESLKLVKLIFDLCKHPILKNEYALCDQLKRAAISVCANIAEGYGRYTKADFKHFISIAIGSSNEVIALLDVLGITFPQMENSTVKSSYMILGKRMYSFRKCLS